MRESLRDLIFNTRRKHTVCKNLLLRKGLNPDQSRSYFISRLRMIVRVNVVLNKTVVDSDWSFDNLCPVVIFRVKVSCITSGDGIKLWLLIGLVN